MTLTAPEQNEFRALARSPELAAEMALLRERTSASVAPEQYLQFASGLNAFLGHPVALRQPFIETDMRL